MKTKLIKVGDLMLEVPDDGEYHTNWTQVNLGIKLLLQRIRDLEEENSKLRRRKWPGTTRRAGRKGSAG